MIFHEERNKDARDFWSRGMKKKSVAASQQDADSST